jgi:MacB-like periplasmic core domain
MRILRAMFFRLRGLFRKEQLDRELGDELESHLAMHVQDNLHSGMTIEEARRDAMIKLGGIEQTKQKYREQRGVPLLETIWKDAGFGMRMLRKNPAFTVVAVLTLALGIGANTAIFSLVNGVLLRSLPYQRPSELVEIYARNAAFDFSDLGMSVPDVADIRAGTTAFVSSAMYQDAPKDLTGAGRPERIEGAKVSEEYFSVLGIHAVVGRVFDAADMRPGTNTVILSHALWRDRFGSDAGAIGKSITLDARLWASCLRRGWPAIPRYGWPSFQVRKRWLPAKGSTFPSSRD